MVSQVTPLLGHIWMFPEQQPAMYNRVRFIYGDMIRRAVPRMLPKELVQVGGAAGGDHLAGEMLRLSDAAAGAAGIAAAS